MCVWGGINPIVTSAAAAAPRQQPQAVQSANGVFCAGSEAMLPALVYVCVHRVNTARVRPQQHPFKSGSDTGCGCCLVTPGARSLRCMGRASKAPPLSTAGCAAACPVEASHTALLLCCTPRGSVCAAFFLRPNARVLLAACGLRVTGALPAPPGPVPHTP